MRIKIVLHYAAMVITIVGFFMLLPLICSLFYREPDLFAFIISTIVTSGFGILLWRLTPVGRELLTIRESLAIITISWVLVAAFGALPYVIAGTFSNYLDAYFEAMSGFTATGATVINAIESQPHGILLWRSLTQWLTGMGIITLFVALFPVMGVGAVNLVKSEMPTLISEKVTSRVRDIAKSVWMIYVGFSILEVISLYIAGLPIYDALTVTFATMATGGFTPTQQSIMTYHSWSVEIIIMLFMIIAAVNFRLFYSLFRKQKFRNFFVDPEFRLYLALLIGGSLLVTLDLITNSGLSLVDAIRYGSFNTVSIMTTTGFNNADFNVWPAFSRAALIVLMIIGGSTGSTAGGIKITRVILLFKNIYRQLLQTINPRAVITLRVGNSPVQEEVINEASSMSILYLTTLVMAFLALSAIGLDKITALSSVTACMGTVGPGLGLVGPMANYLWIPPLGKIILIMCMLLGRLELFTVLALFVPSFWKWR